MKIIFNLLILATLRLYFLNWQPTKIKIKSVFVFHFLNRFSKEIKWEAAKYQKLVFSYFWNNLYVLQLLAWAVAAKTDKLYSISYTI